MIKLQLQGIDKAYANIEKLAKETKQEIQGELDAFGMDVEQQAKQLAPADEGFLRNSIHHKRGELEASIVVTADYAAFMEFGTRKFAAAYVNSLPQDWQTYAAKFKGSGGGGGFDDFLKRIVAWCKRKGIDEDAAYPIARKILIDGLKPKPFLYPAFRDNVVKLKARLKEIIK